MFQSFKPKSFPNSKTETLANIRKIMSDKGLNWFLVPHSDEHQNEYLPEKSERLAYLTGFTGSAGFAIVGMKDAYLFVDGRYTVQARSEVDETLFDIRDLISEPPSKFARSIFSADEVVGFDPWLLTIAQKRDWEQSTAKVDARLKVVQNIIDMVWEDRPPPPDGKAWLHPVCYAGRTAEEKLAEIRKVIKHDKADLLILTDPASLAWTFNIRGNDLVHNPLALGWAIIPAYEKSKPCLFMNEAKFDIDDRDEISKTVDLEDPSEFETSVRSMSKASKIHLDPNLVASSLADMVQENDGALIEKRDPIVILRAIKNEAELEGARSAHIRDGVAMVKFLSWLDAQPAGSASEITAAEALEAFRISTAKELGSELKEISFDTISGSGANGAIVHYRVNETTNKVLENNSLYLVDSGAQYEDGTTDITRTVAIGKPPAQAVKDNTLVLKGHIAIAMAHFPQGTRGVDIDALARMPLWKQGKDYAHGTGHGIGSYLNVHEGPQSISKRGMEPFQPGMIISNEPGYYKEGAYGIRIENLVIVTEALDIDSGDIPMLGFETITLCPIDKGLIDKSLLTHNELEWLNRYHKRVRETLSPHLSDDTLNWLTDATAAL